MESDSTRMLWVSVIEQALFDALSRGSGSGNDAAATWQEKRVAIKWIEEPSDAMRFVCHMAGVPVHWAQEAYIKGKIDD